MDFSQFKIRNLFQPPTKPDNPFSNINFFQPPPTDDQQPDQQVDIPTRMAQLYQPHNELQNRLTAAIDQMPNRANYEPSGFRKFAAALAGLGAGGAQGMEYGRPVGITNNPMQQLAIQRSITDDPFNQAMGDWTNRLKPLEYNANLERESNVNQRQLANETIAREIQNAQELNREKRTKLEEKKIENKRISDEANLKIRQQRADAYEFKATHPNWIAVKSRGGNVHFVNPQNPSQSADTGIPTGQLSDYDKIHMNFNDSVTLENLKEQNREHLEGVRIQGREEVNANKPVKPPVVKPPNTGTTTTTTTSRPRTGISGFFNPGSDTTRIVTKITKPNAPSATEQRPEQVQQSAKRQKAIDILTTNKKLVNEDTIKAVMDQLK
jgi:hypothetical protein